jgi:hypothetical protein
VVWRPQKDSQCVLGEPRRLDPVSEFTPAVWTRKYSIHTSATFARSKDQKIAAEVLVTCELTIFGLRSHSATGEGRADDDNAGTMAEALALPTKLCLFWTGQVSISPERGLPGRSQATKDSAAAGRLGHPRRLVRGPSSSVRQPQASEPTTAGNGGNGQHDRGCPRLTETTSRARLNRWYAWSGNACIAAC